MRRYILHILLLALLVLASAPVSAATVWDGGGADDNWSTDLNWDTDATPAADGTADIQFAGTTRLTPTVDTNDPWAVKTMTFNSGAGAFVLDGNAISINGSGDVLTNNSSVSQTIDNDLVAGGSGTKTFKANSGNIVINGNVNLINGITARSGRNVIFNGVISGSGSVGRTDDGTLKLTNPNNSFTGTIGISHGVLEIDTIADAGVNSAAGAGSAISLGQGSWGPSDTGTLRYTGATASTNRTIMMNSNGTTQGSATLPFSGRPTLEITDANTTLTFNGNLTYNGSSTLGQWRLRGEGTGVINGNITTSGAQLEKNGGGTWIINGDANYSGITEVLAGTLLVNGTHTGGGDYTVASGATLGGGGTIGANLTLDAGSIVSPGESAGLLTIDGNVTMGGTYLWQLTSLADNATGTAGTDFDQIALTAALDVDSPVLDIDLSAVADPDSGNAFWNSSHSWTILTGFTSYSETGSGDMLNATWTTGSFDLQAGAGGNSFELVWQTVPEPGSIVLLGLAALLLPLFWVKKRHSRR